MRCRRVDFVCGISRPGETRADALTATETPEGFLRLEGRIMRAGSLEYGDGRQTWLEHRSRDEIEKSLPTFSKAVLTLLHPEDFVNLDNVQQLDQGHLGSGFTWDSEMPDHVRVDILVTGKDAIKAIREGVAELSVGFTAMVVEAPGVDEAGNNYRFIQRDIVGNHVAIVPEGRAGPNARLLIDSKTAADGAATLAVSGRKTCIDQQEGRTMATITIGEASAEVPEEFAELFANMKAQMSEGDETPPDDEEEDKGRPAPSNDELTSLRAKVDMQEAELAELKADKAGRELDRLRGDAARLKVSLDAVDPSPTAIMRACVLAKRPALKPKLDANASNSGYLAACFDQLLADAAADAPNQVTVAVQSAISDASGKWRDPLFAGNEAS